MMDELAQAIEAMGFDVTIDFGQIGMVEPYSDVVAKIEASGIGQVSQDTEGSVLSYGGEYFLIFAYPEGGTGIEPFEEDESSDE